MEALRFGSGAHSPLWSALLFAASAWHSSRGYSVLTLMQHIVIHTLKILFIRAELTQVVSVSSNETRVNSSITSDTPQLLFWHRTVEDSTATEIVEERRKIQIQTQDTWKITFCLRMMVLRTRRYWPNMARKEHDKCARYPLVLHCFNLQRT